MSTRVRIGFALSLVAVLALALLGASAGARSSFKVKLGDDFFSPDEATIAAGTKVKFDWIGDDEHNVVKKKGPGGFFESGTTDAGGVNFTKKFKKPGRYKLICSVHDEMKMKLKVNG